MTVRSIDQAHSQSGSKRLARNLFEVAHGLSIDSHPSRSNNVWKDRISITLLAICIVATRVYTILDRKKCLELLVKTKYFQLIPNTQWFMVVTVSDAASLFNNYFQQSDLIPQVDSLEVVDHRNGTHHYNDYSLSDECIYKHDDTNDKEEEKTDTPATAATNGLREIAVKIRSPRDFIPIFIKNRNIIHTLELDAYCAFSDDDEIEFDNTYWDSLTNICSSLSNLRSLSLCNPFYISKYN
ncbi:hypothetical protein BDA99DRAFT_541446 [Phascolomyces articulosus]|uniref:Uncharacterized protein n=1 Tax=Phascolomyces articulosus TaxID=60185 RepID=A0AAD5K1F7_9FUNG|nr:hypothetical protein BDA99DRAFT_541446 [Phascolomyces articulosus]